MADAVRAFYERHPYPPPVDSLDRYQRLWHDDQRRRAEHLLLWPGRPPRDDHAILVAGCGTSQAAKVAMRWPRARVTGIDFSATSIRCTEALKQRYALDNLRVRQLAIADVAELTTDFDQIICTGVLHHLADPDGGLRALRAVLAPGGAMHLMVYAPYGRTGIYMFQDLCRLIGVRADSADLAALTDLAAALDALPSTHPLAALLREAPDFREPAGIADALLHPQDRAYAVPQLFDLLQRNGCRFLRWLKQGPYSPRCGIMQLLPHAERLSTRPPAEQYAAAELYRGTMVRHSAIVVRDDDQASVPITFDGDAWRRFVPLPVSDSVTVRDGLPPDVAAVLINRGHTYRDLRLPLDQRALRLVEQMDGRRSAGQLAQVSGLGDEAAAALFERLYLYDQVLFDTSGRPR